MMFDQQAIGRRIQSLRKEHTLTQEQVAIQFNISDRHLRKIEQGTCAASIDLMIEIAVAFAVTLDYLILGKDTTNFEMKRKIHIAIEALYCIEREL